MRFSSIIQLNKNSGCTCFWKIICNEALIRHKQEMFVLLGHKQNDEQQGAAVNRNEDLFYSFKWIKSQIRDFLSRGYQRFEIILIVQPVEIAKRQGQNEPDCH